MSWVLPVASILEASEAQEERAGGAQSHGMCISKEPSGKQMSSWLLI
jgi:hypothetical protein